MNKKLPLVLSTTLLLAMSNTAFAADSKVSGFADIIWTISDEASDGSGTDGKNLTEGKFTVDGEVDFESKLTDKVSARIDLDLAMATTGGANASAITGGPADSAAIEQAFFAWTLQDNLTFLGGVFNNPVGWEAEDAPDLYQTTHSQNWEILDGETALNGNNIAGVALAAALGPITITGALLNDLRQADEENSIAIVVNATPVTGLDLEFGFVTQETGAENVMDINATYKNGDYTAAIEILTADEVIDNSIMLLGNVSLPMGFGVTGRIEKVAFDSSGVSDTDVITVAGTYQAADNLSVVLEWSTKEKFTDTGVTDNDLITAEFISKF